MSFAVRLDMIVNCRKGDKLGFRVRICRVSRISVRVTG